jgi:hypothetical protein
MLRSTRCYLKSSMTASGHPIPLHHVTTRFQHLELPRRTWQSNSTWHLSGPLFVTFGLHLGRQDSAVRPGLPLRDRNHDKPSVSCLFFAAKEPDLTVKEELWGALHVFRVTGCGQAKNLRCHPWMWCNAMSRQGRTRSRKSPGWWNSRRRSNLHSNGLNWKYYL